MTFARNVQECRERRAAEREANLRHLATTPIRSLHRGSYEGETSGQRIDKENAVRSEAYRRLVAALPCKACGIPGYSQAAHPNTGKGAGLKTSDVDCFPLCGPRPTGAGIVPGCHVEFDQGVMFTKAERRAIEPAWAADTRRAIKAAGLWPKGLLEVKD